MKKSTNTWRTLSSLLVASAMLIVAACANSTAVEPQKKAHPTGQNPAEQVEVQSKSE